MGRTEGEKILDFRCWGYIKDYQGKAIDFPVVISNSCKSN